MEEHVEQILDKVLRDAPSVFLVSLKILGGKSSLVIEVLLDTDKGITLEECARISRSFSEKLEMQNVIEKSYNIVMSSPGITRSITHPRQFLKCIGKTLKICYLDDREREVFKEYILSSYNAREDKVKLQTLKKDEEVEIQRKKIKSAIIKLKW